MKNYIKPIALVTFMALVLVSIFCSCTNKTKVCRCMYHEVYGNSEINWYEDFDVLEDMGCAQLNGGMNSNGYEQRNQRSCFDETTGTPTPEQEIIYHH